MPVTKPFIPAWWLINAHAQTIWPSTFRNIDIPDTEKERIELSDGDFLDLHWMNRDQQAPVVIVLHGLGGSIHSHYIKGILPVLAKNQFRVCLMHARTAAGVINRLPRSYHAGETADLRHVVEYIKTQHSNIPVMAVGYSIGGSMLLNYLHRFQGVSRLDAAIAISVPYNLAECAAVLNSGIARVYQKHILDGLKQTTIKKFSKMKGILELQTIRRIKSIYEYDQFVTAPLHGFTSADSYYAQCSVGTKLSDINTDTLLIHSTDDPFMSATSVPKNEMLSNRVKLELYDKGGHVGFLSGNQILNPEYWLEQRIPVFLKEHI